MPFQTIPIRRLHDPGTATINKDGIIRLSPVDLSAAGIDGAAVVMIDAEEKLLAICRPTAECKSQVSSRKVQKESIQRRAITCKAAFSAMGLRAWDCAGEYDIRRDDAMLIIDLKEKRNHNEKDPGNRSGPD